MVKENRRGSGAVLVVLCIIILLIAIGIWVYFHRLTTSTLNTGSLSSSSTSATCSNASTTHYENQQMGITFCYPSSLIVTTGTIVWPEYYVDIASNTSTPTHPTIGFGVITDASPIISSSSVTGGVPELESNVGLLSCEGFGGKYGNLYAAFPQQSQVITKENQYGLTDYFFRYNIVSTQIPMVTSDAGPFGYIPLQEEKYVYFSVPGCTDLPSYVDKNLQTILSSLDVVSSTQ
jgi:hypothetical protein